VRWRGYIHFHRLPPWRYDDFYFWFVFAEHPFLLIFSPCRFSSISTHQALCVFDRGTWGCAAFLCAVSSSFTPRTRSAGEPQRLSWLFALSVRSGLICYIRHKNRIPMAKTPAERRVVSWGLPNNHNLRRETRCSVDSWMCDRLWFHYICTHGYSFRRFSDWNRRGTYGWTALCPCCTVQVCSRIGLATWSQKSCTTYFCLWDGSTILRHLWRKMIWIPLLGSSQLVSCIRCASVFSMDGCPISNCDIMWLQFELLAASRKVFRMDCKNTFMLLQGSEERYELQYQNNPSDMLTSVNYRWSYEKLKSP